MEADPPSDDEGAMIARAQAGERSAQDELFRRHLPGVLAWVRLKRRPLVAQRESSMDIVQTVFRLALLDLGRFEYRGTNSFRNWLLEYTKNRLRDRARYHGAVRRGPDREVDAALSQFHAAIATPSQAVASKKGIEAFERAFERLSEADREIILLARVEDLGHAAIAARRGISEAASKKALSRAVARLAAFSRRGLTAAPG
ncbi:MAG: sigma-70 family RNA polymerase sigma factor [Planctomycetes bacterium]|nr:sigma-70 family RNA polymerase sigma factor [Planctomycetota bacterium]